MSLQDLFPFPRELERAGEDVPITGRSLRVATEAGSPAVTMAIAEVRAAWDEAAGPAQEDGAAFALTCERDAGLFAGQPHADEEYKLDINSDGAMLRAATDRGLALGCQTLRQLLKGDGQVPAVRIADWPELAWRGLYVESKWGPDLMSLDDWKHLVDEMARLKFNSLGVGVHGCWIVQYGGKRTEFLMLPFPEHPEAATPKTLRWYSPRSGEWQTLSYLPAIVEEDFFGDLVAYGSSRNVIVRPHFNFPGHNTLFPRVFPEIASVDDDGNPKGYGFCLSNPQTYERIFALYDSVIDRYLAPHGVDWFHIGLDEVEGYMGISEEDPTIVVDPWCECAQCRATPRDQQLRAYAVRVCAHLRDRGITTITMWNDALEKEGALDETFGAMLAEAGLTDHVVVQWWRYRDPVLVPRPEIGVRAWSTPMAGYWTNLFMQSYTSNIYAMLLAGHAAGIEGADAYCIYDSAFDRNYAALAQFSWNPVEGEDLFQFKSRYADAVAGRELGRARATEAFVHFDQAFDCEPFAVNEIGSLGYYWHTYPASRLAGPAPYPQKVVFALLQDRMRMVAGLANAASHARSARTLFEEAASTHGESDPLLAEYIAECDKLVGVWETFALILQAARGWDDPAGDAADAVAALDTARERLLAVLARLESVKARYLQPQILRDLSMLLLYADGLREDMAQAVLDSDGSRVTFAALATNQRDLDHDVAPVDRAASVS